MSPPDPVGGIPSPVPSIDRLVRTVAAGLLERGWTFAAAESCTGGLLLKSLTDLPGSSHYVLGGVVAYSDDLKRGLLGVDAEVLASHGAVSEAVAIAMAVGVADATGANLGVAITGVAGPGGGTPDKPVGTVWCAVAPRGASPRAIRSRFDGDRAQVRELATRRALELLVEVTK
jgi:PncC family amidohydrolase